MEAYTGFAAVYDTFMDNVPYGEWCEYLTGLLKENGVESGLVLDLGCGTGSLTELLAARGYDMIGIDYSEEMLELAAGKRAESGQDILYLCQDMREFELYGTVRAVVSICDCINYITDPADLAEVFSLVNNYLDPGGVFIFDLNTEYKYITAIRSLIESSTLRSWETPRWQRTGRNPVLSGTTSMIRRRGSIFTIWRYSCGRKTVFTGNTRRPITSGLIP